MNILSSSECQSISGAAKFYESTYGHYCIAVDKGEQLFFSCYRSGNLINLAIDITGVYLKHNEQWTLLDESNFEQHGITIIGLQDNNNAAYDIYGLA